MLADPIGRHKAAGLPKKTRRVIRRVTRGGEPGIMFTAGMAHERTGQRPIQSYGCDSLRLCFTMPPPTSSTPSVLSRHAPSTS